MQDVPHRVRVAKYHAEVPALAAPGQASIIEERAPVRECERDVLAPACGSENPSGAAAEVLSDAVKQHGVQRMPREWSFDEEADLSDATAEVLCGRQSEAADGIAEGGAKRVRVSIEEPQLHVASAVVVVADAARVPASGCRPPRAVEHPRAVLTAGSTDSVPEGVVGSGSGVPAQPQVFRKEVPLVVGIG